MESIIPPHETQFLQFSIYSNYLHELSAKAWKQADGFSNYFWNSTKIYRFRYGSHQETTN